MWTCYRAHNAYRLAGTGSRPKILKQMQREARAVENDNLPLTHRLDSTATLPLYLSRARVVKLCKEAWISVGVARLQIVLRVFFKIKRRCLPTPRQTTQDPKKTTTLRRELSSQVSGLVRGTRLLPALAVDADVMWQILDCRASVSPALEHFGEVLQIYCTKRHEFTADFVHKLVLLHLTFERMCRTCCKQRRVSVCAMKCAPSPTESVHKGGKGVRTGVRVVVFSACARSTSSEGSKSGLPSRRTSKAESGIHCGAVLSRRPDCVGKCWWMLVDRPCWYVAGSRAQITKPNPAHRHTWGISKTDTSLDGWPQVLSCHNPDDSGSLRFRLRACLAMGGIP